MSIESKIYLDLARIWNVGPGEVEKLVRDYIGAVTCDFKPLQPYPKPHIKPVKVKSLKERLEEATMHEDCYFCIKRDICTRDVPKPCKYRYTEDERKADQASDIYGYILAGMYLPKTYQKKKEETKMNATSTETFYDIIAIDFELQTFPNPDVQDKFIVSATNRDDIFCFVFEGPDLRDACRNAGLFTGWEKDQKIRELEKELNNWKKEAADCLKLRDEAQKEAYKLKKKNEELKERLNNIEPFRSLERTIKEKQQMKEDYEEKIRELKIDNKNLTEAYDILDKTLNKTQKKCNEWYEKWVKWLHKYENIKEEYKEKLNVLQRKYNLEREANEAQHKFFRQYAGDGTEIEFNYAISDTDEVTYVIVDKEEYKNLGNYVYLGSIPYSADDIKKLKEQIKKLEELKTPTIENFADEEPSSRRDILRCAEKCVCGHREQDYGSPESNFQLIADLWNDYLKKEKSDIVVDAMDVAMMMSLLKIARIRNGGGSGDSFVDLAGYAACGGEIWHSKKETNGDLSQDTN